MTHTDTQNQTTDENEDNENNRGCLYYDPIFEAKCEEYERRQKIKDQIGNLVFSLRKSMPRIGESQDTPLAELLENNARALHAAFEYYFDNASKSPEGDRKIALGLRAHAQMVRAVHTLERLRTSKYEGTN